VFYAHNGKRHWVPSEPHLRDYGLALADTVDVSKEEIQQYAPSGPIPFKWSEAAWNDPPRTSPGTLREVATSKLSGSGIEFGAGTSPVSVPVTCDVRFADFVAEDELRARRYEQQGDDFVRLSYVMGMEDMRTIADATLDFVIAAHVIEHLRNPLRAFEQVHRKLKPGGYFVLFVPEKTLTFDKERELTSLEHLIEDYEAPSAERDAAHYFEFFRKVYAVPESVLEQRVRDAIAQGEDLHVHTWTHDSFKAMVEYSQGRMSPWRSIWSQPAVSGVEHAQEFYFVLQK
jgi:SAM-dependent methyltransferase